MVLMPLLSRLLTLLVILTMPLFLARLTLIPIKSDRKSGSAGMPRPISYAVFCLKKKKRQAGLAHPLHQLWQRAELVVDAQARQRDVNAQRREHLVHPLDQLLEVRVVAGAEAEEADLVVTRVAVAFEGRLHDRLDGAHAQGPFDDGRLAEAALPRAAAHDLDGDAVVRGLDVGDDRSGRQRDGVEVLVDRAGQDLARNVASR